MNALYLAALDGRAEEVTDALAVCLWQVFGFEVRRMDALPDPVFAYDRQRGQYSSTLILRDLLKRVPPDALRVLAVTERDLFIPMLSFVFGHAQFNGPVAVISLARLRQEFYRLPANSGLLTARAMKEAIHELGHTFGLTHCPDARCAMSLSNAVQHVDAKREELCKGCSIILEEQVKQLHIWR